MAKRIGLVMMITGLSGIVAQLLLLRELLIVFSGNEFTIGVIFANWLILESFGCIVVGRTSRNSKRKVLLFLLLTLLFSLAFPLMVILTRSVRNILGLSIGEAIGIIPVIYSSFIILLPISIPHGALFTFGCNLYSGFSKDYSPSIGKVYIYEIVGTIIGGVLWTYLFIALLNALQTAFILALLNFLACFLLIRKQAFKSHQTYYLMKAVLTVLVVTALFGIVADFPKALHESSVTRQWKGQKIVHYENSVFGNITVMEVEGQYTFFLDGTPRVSTPVPDIVFVEEFVHIPLLAHPEPAKLLVLSGGAGGVIGEILNHKTVTNIDYAEIDPLILDLIRKFPTDLTEMELTDSRVNIEHLDGRLFLRMTDKRYDCIMVGLREPSDLQTNRFFTQEFFALVKSRLQDDGIFVIGVPGSLTLHTPELRDLNSSLYLTLKSVFAHVRPIPGEGTNLFISSNNLDLTTIGFDEIRERLLERDLQREVQIPWNIEHKLNPRWLSWFSDFINDASLKENRDFRPISLFYNLTYWNSLFNPTLSIFFNWFEHSFIWVFIIVSTIVLITFLWFKLKKVSSLRFGIALCLGSTGFTGMMLDLVIIFSFQAIYGYVFSWIGLLVTAFMTGSALGAAYMTAKLKQIKNSLKTFIITDVSIALYSLLLPLILILLRPYLETPALSNWLRFFLLLLSVISGFFVGFQFPLANRINLRNREDISNTAGLLYGSDLLGGWLGGIFGGLLLMPVLGLFYTCLTIFFLKVCSLIILVANPIRIKQ